MPDAYNRGIFDLNRQSLASVRGEKQLKYLGERISIMNEGLIVTLLIVNIALSGAALLGVFVVLGMLKGKEE